MINLVFTDTGLPDTSPLHPQGTAPSIVELSPGEDPSSVEDRYHAYSVF